MSMKTIKINHPENNLIIKADLDKDKNKAVIKKINFGLRQKATKLEKDLLKYVEIYCYDVFRTNMMNSLLNSKEYIKFLKDNKLE